MDKATILRLASRHLCPDRVRRFEQWGVDLVIGRRRGYRLWDVDGREFFDLHLNGGTFNLGHAHPEVLATLREASAALDIGNHHFPSEARAQLAAALAATTDGRLPLCVLAPSGSEAIDVAIKSARWATGRRKIVGVEGGYHGRTGLSGAAGDAATAAFFQSDRPDEFVTAPFNDLDALRLALAGGDVAAVLLETIPATLGFPTPQDGYLQGVRRLCDDFGALYIADEVQTGLGRTGRLWGVDAFGAEPDVLVAGKGLSGGLYPMAATLLSDRAGAWLHEDGWAHISTFGGAELGCAVALKTLEITQRSETVAGVAALSDFFAEGLARLQDASGPLVEIRQKGLVIGLKFDAPDGGLRMSKALYDQGVWAMFAGFDPSVLQFKPGLLLSLRDAEDILQRLERAIRSF